MIRCGGDAVYPRADSSGTTSSSRTESSRKSSRSSNPKSNPLQVLAGDGRESVDAMLTRMFEELTDVNQERLARVIPGLAEAMAWPDSGESDRAC